MTDDPLPTHRVCSPNFEGSIDTGAHLIPPPYEMDKKTDGQVRDLITDLINSVAAATLDGAEKVAVIARAQYYMQELARREQDRQTEVMTEHTKKVKDYTVIIGVMTIGITIMSFVSMITVVWSLVRAH